MLFETVTGILNKSRNKISKYQLFIYKEITNITPLTTKGHQQTQFYLKVCGAVNRFGLSVISTQISVNILLLAAQVVAFS